MALFDKMKPEFKCRMGELKPMFPTMISRIEDELKNLDHRRKITLETCIDLEQLFDMNPSIRISFNIYSIFNE